METLRLLAVMAAVAAACGGCEGNKKPPSSNGGLAQGGKASMMTVVVEGNQPFPQDMVGTWRADRNGWEFVFNPDGTISSAVISMGRVRMEPGKTAVVPMINDGQGTFEPGPWAVHCDAESRTLTVHIEIQRLRVEVVTSLVTGRSRDTFVGTVSPDGKTWDVVWTSFPDYVASTDGGQTSVPLGTDEYGIEHQLIFEKVPPESVAEPQGQTNP